MDKCNHLPRPILIEGRVPLQQQTLEMQKESDHQAERAGIHVPVWRWHAGWCHRWLFFLPPPPRVGGLLRRRHQARTGTLCRGEKASCTAFSWAIGNLLFSNTCGPHAARRQRIARQTTCELVKDMLAPNWGVHGVINMGSVHLVSLEARRNANTRGLTECSSAPTRMLRDMHRLCKPSQHIERYLQWRNEPLLVPCCFDQSSHW